MKVLTTATGPANSLGHPDHPHLDLSGPRLAAAFESMLTGSEALGGIEAYVAALKLKQQLFTDVLGPCGSATLELNAFKSLCPFMAGVRRRIGPYLEEEIYPLVAGAVGALISSGDDTNTTDERLMTFCTYFPTDKSHRWTKDLGAEILHNLDPERYPLMNRWVWDRKSNTGVLREIWFADEVNHITIDVGDAYATFLVLREELSQFLSNNGVFRDVSYYVDLLCAQIYADYICAQGGSYLRADFASPDDPMQYVRRLLGLDGVKAKSGRTRLKAIDGEAYVIEEDRSLLG